MAGSSCRSADSGGDAPTWSPAWTMSVRDGARASAALRYDASTAAPPTGLPATFRVAVICPWKSLNPRSFTGTGLRSRRYAGLTQPTGLAA